MDVRQPLQPVVPRRVLSVRFNDDKSAFAIGLETGFWVLHSSDASVMMKKELMSGIGLAQMRGISSILALVGGGVRPKFAGNRVIIWNALNDTGSADIETMTPVRGVKIVSDKIYVALQHSVQIHNVDEGALLHKYPTADNLGGVICVSDKQVAFPGQVAGQIKIVELATNNVSMIIGHDAPLRCLSFSQDGEMLASASEKGTMIHVYNTRNCALITEVRRGMDPAYIYDLCFSPSGALLAATSDKGTLHIFDIPGRSGSSSSISGKTSTATTNNNRPPESPTSFNGGYGGGNSSRPGSSSSSMITAPTPNPDEGTGWGWLARVPLIPKAFRDTYSFANAKFELGEEPEGVPDADEYTALGTTKAQKGVVGWYTEHDLVVVGAGYDARWEKFRMAEQDSGKRFVARIGWKRFYSDQQ